MFLSSLKFAGRFIFNIAVIGRGLTRTKTQPRVKSYSTPTDTKAMLFFHQTVNPRQPIDDKCKYGKLLRCVIQIYIAHRDLQINCQTDENSPQLRGNALDWYNELLFSSYTTPSYKTAAAALEAFLKITVS